MIMTGIWFSTLLAEFYQGFGLPKASLAQVLSPAVGRQGMKSYARGYRPAPFRVAPAKCLA